MAVGGFGHEAHTLSCIRFVGGKRGLSGLLLLPLECLREALLSQVFVPQLGEVLVLFVKLAVVRIHAVLNESAPLLDANVVGDIFAMDREQLDLAFGSYAQRLYELARGIDHNPVVPNRIRKQISAEDTFPDDIPLSACEEHLRRLAEKVWRASKNNERGAKTIVLKLKTKEFQSLTRSLTTREAIASCEALAATALSLCTRVDLPNEQLYRLIGVGLSNFLLDVERSKTPESESQFLSVGLI